jgi:hypothetical protein
MYRPVPAKSIKAHSHYGMEALGMAGAEAAAAQAMQEPAGQPAMPADTPYPKLSIITPYSPEKLAFAAQAGYEGVVVTPGPDFTSRPTMREALRPLISLWIDTLVFMPDQKPVWFR